MDSNTTDLTTCASGSCCGGTCPGDACSSSCAGSCSGNCSQPVAAAHEHAHAHGHDDVDEPDQERRYIIDESPAGRELAAQIEAYNTACAAISALYEETVGAAAAVRTTRMTAIDSPLARALCAYLEAQAVVQDPQFLADCIESGNIKSFEQAIDRVTRTERAYTRALERASDAAKAELEQQIAELDADFTEHEEAARRQATTAAAEAGAVLQSAIEEYDRSRSELPPATEASSNGASSVSGC